MQPSCCVGYYPGGIGKFAAEEPSCPVMLHFGAEDAHIGQEQVEAVRSAHQEVEIFVYPGAGHGFNCDARSSYHAPSSALARKRTLEFLKTHVA
jgi:carboxymethylenebutenolidase